MDILGFDHIVISANDVQATLRFYRRVLGMEVSEEKPNKWALHFGQSKISVQDASALPEIARQTTPGSANFCLYSNNDIEEVVEQLRAHEIEVIAGPSERIGANGAILSVYFNDPDGNLVELCNRLHS